jgi:RimJ/RimL family protein N-acetyltransferase
MLMYCSELRFCAFREVHAEALLSWRYAAPYSMYSLQPEDHGAALKELLLPELHYVAVLDEHDNMIAFRCFGADAQVPGGAYVEEALDLGGGLRPDLTGRGLGQHVIAAAMNYAMRRFAPRMFRTTVASFNQRAGKVCERLGYQVARSFVRPSDGMSFNIFLKEAQLVELVIPMKEA